MSTSRFSFSTAFLASLLGLAALGHGLLAVLAMREKSTTSDELAHVTGGYTFDHWNDYRMHPENGLLPQRWQALPTVLEGAHYPDLSEGPWGEANVWMTGYHFFYQRGNNHEWMLFTARAMNACFGVGLVLLVAAWARHLFGWAGAFTAVVFGALCPTMLAHSALATSDMAMALFLLGSVSAYWWHLRDGRWQTGLLSALVFGLACVAKYTAVLLLPLFALLALLRCLHPAPLTMAGRTFATPGGKLGAIAATTLLHGGAAVLFIWTFCGFRYAAFNPALPPGAYTLGWDYVLGIGGWKAQVINSCRTWHLLPEGYLYGFTFVLRFAEARAAFLDGDTGIYGWVSFFPKAFLYKTPVSLLLAVTAAATLLLLWVREQGLGRFRAQLYRTAPLWLLFAVYWSISLTSHLNIGHRHILPTYPILYIFTGLLGWTTVRAWRKSRTGGLVIASLVALMASAHVATAWSIHPNYLAYFSPVVGGPDHGYEHLVDSSLDWGQDLPGLKHWLDANRRPGEPVYISYFGTSEPDYYGIAATRMPMIHYFRRARPWYWPEPGIYAVSATMLQQVYMPQGGAWTPERERRYQQLRLNDANFHSYNQGSGRLELLKSASAAEWSQAWDLYEELRFARLCHYLRARGPDTQINHSILIYRLSAPELDTVVNGDLRALARAIDEAMSRRKP